MLLQEDFANHIRLIIISPNYTQQHLLLLQFIQNAKSAYVRLNSDIVNKAELLRQVEAVSGTVSVSDIEYIVLDECDRVTSVILTELLLDLLQIAPSARVVVFSRRLPQSFIHNPEIHAITQVLPIRDDNQMANSIPKLEVHAFGQGRVYVDGKEITEWNGQLTRNLFFYMIDNPIITRDVIFETFWSGMPMAEASNVFHVTKRNIHNALGFELITFSGHYYRVKDSVDLYYDVTDFFEKSERGMHERDVALLTATHQLFKYPFLQGTAMEWVETRREELQLQYAEAMSVLADLRIQDGNLDAALGLNIRILSIDRKREDLARRIMELYVQRNQPCDAVKIYNQTEQFLEETLGVKPDEPLKQAAEEARLLCGQQGME